MSTEVMLACVSLTLCIYPRNIDVSTHCYDFFSFTPICAAPDRRRKREAAGYDLCSPLAIPCCTQACHRRVVSRNITHSTVAQGLRAWMTQRGLAPRGLSTSPSTNARTSPSKACKLYNLPLPPCNLRNLKFLQDPLWSRCCGEQGSVKVCRLHLAL